MDNTAAAGRPDSTVTLARVLGGIGRSLIAAGVIILLFAGYQLWGTGLHERQAQDDLTNEFADTLATGATFDLEAIRQLTTTTAAPQGPAEPATTAPPPTVPKSFTDLLYPEQGNPVALIRIPRIGVNKVVVEGTGLEDLKNGPGHFSETPLPGQAGNAAIAGHRTTYGAPFGDIDQLSPGDEIRITTVLGEAVYQVEGTRIVEPTQVEVVDNFGDNRITLTACHPKFSASKRIVVWGILQGEPVPTIPKPTDRRTVESPASELPAETTAAPATASSLDPATTLTTAAPSTTGAPTTAASTLEADADAAAEGLTGPGLHGDPDAWPPTFAWAGACAAVALAAWYLGRRLERPVAPKRARRYVAYVVASPVFLFCLYSCFTHVDRLLPAY